MGFGVVVPWVSCSDRHLMFPWGSPNKQTPQSCIQQDLDCSGFGLCQIWVTLDRVILRSCKFGWFMIFEQIWISSFAMCDLQRSQPCPMRLTGPLLFSRHSLENVEKWVIAYYQHQSVRLGSPQSVILSCQREIWSDEVITFETRS